MDILIALGTGSKAQDIELKYALRGIEKHLLGYKNVILVGTKPNWIKNIDYIPAEDIPGKKQFSIFRKIMMGSEGSTYNFAFWNDDHFLLKDLAIEDIKFWYEKEMDYWKKLAIGQYQKAVINTMELPGVNNYYTDIHFPIIYNRGKFEKLQDLEWGKKEYVIKSAYTRNETEGFEPAFDLKLSDPRISKEQILAKIKNRLFFSTGPHSMTPFMKSVLHDKFPHKSKFEK